MLQRLVFYIAAHHTRRALTVGVRPQISMVLATGAAYVSANAKLSMLAPSTCGPLMRRIAPGGEFVTDVRSANDACRTSGFLMSVRDRVAAPGRNRNAVEMHSVS